MTLHDEVHSNYTFVSPVCAAGTPFEPGFHL